MYWNVWWIKPLTSFLNGFNGVYVFKRTSKVGRLQLQPLQPLQLSSWELWDYSFDLPSYPVTVASRMTFLVWSLYKTFMCHCYWVGGWGRSKWFTKDYSNMEFWLTKATTFPIGLWFVVKDISSGKAIKVQDQLCPWHKKWRLFVECVFLLSTMVNHH